MKTRVPRQKAAPVELRWTHCGAAHRVTLWPEVKFQSLVGNRWAEYEPDPSSDSFASAAAMISATSWKSYMEYIPATEHEFLDTFTSGQLAALVVLTRCPALKAELNKMPALTAFIATHVKLRGTTAPRWDEITAIYNRSGLFGLLEWLGLPATKLTLEILEKVCDAHLARRSLEPLRALFWDIPLARVLNCFDSISEQSVFRHVRALAA